MYPVGAVPAGVAVAVTSSRNSTPRLATSSGSVHYAVGVVAGEDVVLGAGEIAPAG